jgi:hypothetical protein
MRTHTSIIDRLHRLNALAPTQDFSARSRRLILASAQAAHSDTIPETLHAYRFSTIMVRTTLFAAGMAIVLTGLFYGSQYFSPLFLPGLNQDKIVAEADMIDNTITIQLSQLHYFDTTSQASAHALKQVANPTLSHLNTAVIFSDTQQIQMLSPTDTDTTSQQIQDILKTLQK